MVKIIKPKPFFGQVPTAPEVELLFSSFGVPEHGKVIKYDEISSVIGIPHGAHRWNTITKAWRDRLLDTHGVLIKSGLGVFRVLDDRGKLDAAAKKGKTALRCARSAERFALAADERKLDEDGKKIRNFWVTLTARTRLAEAVQPKQLD